jgi:hypothetical protein
MHIVRTDTRPYRLGLCISDQPSPRVLRRAFRLMGGRWGGVFDVLVIVEPDKSLNDFNRSVLKRADPDYVLVIDPRLDDFDPTALIDELNLQPFQALRFRERAEQTMQTMRSVFRERPSAVIGTGGEQVIDYDNSTLTWRRAAEYGLPSSPTRRVRVAPQTSKARTPVEWSRRGLRSRSSTIRWMVFGTDTDIRAAAGFWSLRALGARPEWMGPDDLDNSDAPVTGRRLRVYAPGEDQQRVASAVKRWTADGVSVGTSENKPIGLGSGSAYFASHVQPATEHAGLLRFSLPAPPVTGEPLSGALSGVAEYHLQSSDPKSPDGTMLAPVERSRELVAAADPWRNIRVTQRGIAQEHNISRATLVTIPAISYEQAVAAPLHQAGYELEPSDKGRFQQRSLELARGLRFLAWCLRQRESARLLDLFFEHHLGTSPRADYRRAVTLNDLRNRLHDDLRAKRPRLRRPLLDRAEEWLVGWTDALLERGLLISGYVLACQRCAYRGWYRADDIGQQFTCERCAATSHLSAAAVRSFRLNEAFWQLRRNNGQVVTLLLAALRDQARWSLLYLPELGLSSPNTAAGEADVVALLDGALILAEAKSNNTLSKAEIGWYRTVAARVHAHRLVFATTDNSNRLCQKLECESCEQQGGAYHRDYAWDNASRARIQETRDKLLARNIEVETVCYQTLIDAHADAKEELAPFTG